MPPKSSKPPVPQKPKIPAIVWSAELTWMLISTAEVQENRNVMVGKLKEDVSSLIFIKYVHILIFHLPEHDGCQQNKGLQASGSEGHPRRVCHPQRDCRKANWNQMGQVSYFLVYKVFPYHFFKAEAILSRACSFPPSNWGWAS
jgi:hypothetical protein